MYFKANLSRKMACFYEWRVWPLSQHMDFVTSLCKAGVEITSSFLVGLRIMRITQRTLKVWTASAVPKAFPSRAAYRWQRGAPAVHRDTLDNPGRAAAEEAGKPVLDTDSKPSSCPEVQPDNPGVTYLVMKRTKIPNIWSHWDVWGFVKEQRQPFKHHTVGL